MSYLVQDRVSDFKLGVQFGEVTGEADGVPPVGAVAKPGFGVVELEGPSDQAMFLHQFVCEGFGITQFHTFIQSRLSTPHV